MRSYRSAGGVNQAERKQVKGRNVVRVPVCAGVCIYVFVTAIELPFLNGLRSKFGH